MIRTGILAIGLVAAPLMSTSVSAQVTTVGLDDFDGGGNFLTRSFSPDNSGNTGFGGTPGTFGGSFFDVFGITTRDIGFSFADDSAGSFADDDFGIIGTSDTDNFVGFADTENGNNPNSDGTVSINWTYDISGFSNLNLSFDFAAVGNFQDSDTITVVGSIDGGPSQLLFNGAGTGTTGENGSVGSAYTVTMEGGTTYDRFEDAFFSESDWDNLLLFGNGFVDGSSTFNYASSDANEDGFDDFTGEKTYEEENNFGTFTNSERNLFHSQFEMNGIGLDNDLQTITAAIEGTGSILELELVAIQNGSQAAMALEDLLLEGEESITPIFIAGDYNGDNIVDQLDLNLVLFNWNQEGLPDGWLASDQLDGAVDQIELNNVLFNWNTTGPAPSVTDPVFASIPEPASAVLIGLLSTTALRRRR